jgi:hypothetical protein
MIPDDDTPASDDLKADTAASATESATKGPSNATAPHVAETTEAPTGAAPDAAGDPSPNQPVPDDPPVDDRLAKGKGDKARAATLGQVAAPKPKPAKEDPADTPVPDESVIRTRAFPGPLLAFGGRARRTGWAAGFEITAQNATDRTGRTMKLMISGNRAGPIEWKPEHLADELVADDWEVTVPNDQMATFLSIQNGDANPSEASAA